VSNSNAIDKLNNIATDEFGRIFTTHRFNQHFSRTQDYHKNIQRFQQRLAQPLKNKLQVANNSFVSYCLCGKKRPSMGILYTITLTHAPSRHKKSSESLRAFSKH